MYKAWQLAAIEAAGYMDTKVSSSESNHRIANYLAEYGSDNIETDEFRDACIACSVDPDSITSSDLEEIQDILDDLT